MSETRKRYMIRLVLRCVILIVCICLWLFRPQTFAVLEKGRFFAQFSFLHILWVIWVVEMILQIIPIKNRIPLGSQKLFAMRFKPIVGQINREHLHKYVVTTSKAAYRVFLLWCLLIAVIAGLYYTDVIGKNEMFMISAIFYVCDLICVLIWCPFRLLMKTRCCTTCRIFNWDHLMMFSPLAFVGGFYAASLFLIALLAWLVWEFCIMLYPERFWEQSNAALRCSECTDKLCTQYCQKLRK